MNAFAFKNDGGTRFTHHCHAAEKMKMKLRDIKHSETLHSKQLYHLCFQNRRTWTKEGH